VGKCKGKGKGKGKEYPKMPITNTEDSRILGLPDFESVGI